MEDLKQEKLNEIQLPDELDNVCKAVGQFIEYWGFKEIEGRVWCHILLSKHPLCAQDLIARMGVSKALISLSLARLIDYDVIRIEYTKYKRTQYYQVNENVTKVIKNVLRYRERKLLSDIKSSVQLLGDLSSNELININIKRIKFLQKMISIGQGFLDTIIFTNEGITNFFFGKAPKVEKEKA